MLELEAMPIIIAKRQPTVYYLQYQLHAKHRIQVYYNYLNSNTMELLDRNIHLVNRAAKMRYIDMFIKTLCLCTQQAPDTMMHVGLH